MKKIITLLSIGLICSNLNAQKAKLQSASNYLKYEELSKAKEAIDLASAHEDTKIMGKTWHYKGKIYSAIANSKDEAYKELVDNGLSIAYDSYLKAFELGGKKLNLPQLRTDFAQLINPMYENASALYKNKDYTNAAQMFVKTSMISKKLDIVDSIATYNAGASYEKAEMWEKAIVQYLKCLDIGFRGSEMYQITANAYVRNNQEDKALALIRDKGLAKYPNDNSLINYQFNMYLDKDDYDGALKSVNASIKNEPNNPIYYYNKGYILGQKGEADSVVINTYQKAIDLDDKYYDAIFNIGAIYFTNAENKIKERNDLPLNQASKADQLMNECLAYYDKALPYLEKAHEIRPQERETLKALRKIYIKQKKDDKAKYIEDLLKN